MQNFMEGNSIVIKLERIVLAGFVPTFEKIKISENLSLNFVRPKGRTQT